MDHQEMLWATQEAARAERKKLLKRMRPREATVEASFVRALKRHGLTTLKLNLQGNRGWPDRLVLLPGGRCVFIELKRPGGKARALQLHVHAKLRALGFEVAVCDNAVAAAAFVYAAKDRWEPTK